MNKTGFGFLRLPQKGNTYDWEGLSNMVDVFLKHGGKYFDTCPTYLNGYSEEGIRRSLSGRHDRDEYFLADKLPGYLCRSEEDAEKYFNASLEKCGVDYFDAYMLHWLNRENYEHAEQYHQFAFLEKKKREGKVRTMGFSFHDSASLLEEILLKHPEIDVVLLQINYMDWESPAAEAKKCYEAAVRFGKRIFVMEPVKGGTLAALPEEAEKQLRQVHPEMSPSDWALGFVQSLPEVEVCFSGMNTAAQVIANSRDYSFFGETEREVLLGIRKLVSGSVAIPCTGCRYCERVCPQSIPISEYFKMYNAVKAFPEDDWKIIPVYQSRAGESKAASACIGCDSCTSHCPQRIPVREMVGKVSDSFERN